MRRTTRSSDDVDDDDPVADDDEGTQKYGWFARGDKIPNEIRIPFNRPSVRQIYDSLPFVRRYFLYWLKRIGKKETLFINTFQPLKHKPYYGVPCGSIGSGSIGRDFRGGFCKYGLRPGLVEHEVDTLKANQFILTLRRKNIDSTVETVYQKVLCACSSLSNSAELAVWDFSFPPDKLNYRGLYPRSWTYYSIPEFDFILCIRQISPVIPDDYKDSSLPVTVFVVDAENNSADDLQVIVTFTFRNGTGYHKWSNEGNCKADIFEMSGESSKVKGVYLKHTINQMQCTYAIGATTNDDTSTVLCCAGFDPCGTGEDIWTPLRMKGCFENECKNTDTKQLGIAVAAQKLVKSKTNVSSCMEFALVWDMPIVYFGGRQRSYKRRYTRFFGDRGIASPAICAYSLATYREWERRIEEWQNPVLNHLHIPDWYKSAIFNELYYFTDGGSIWFEYEASWIDQEKHLSNYTLDLMKQYGRFGYLESWEYRMLNTYDVHFYASFALAQLWPHLEHTLQAEITDQVDLSDEQLVHFIMEGDLGPVKSSARVPHDLGNPAIEPWLCTNAYVTHNTGKWKDLNLKFILTCCRDYFCIFNRDKRFLHKVWPTIKYLVAEALDCWDQDDDGMIENFGAADQTYDAWKMSGVSAYCGCLWLATLRAATSLANEMNDRTAANRYTEILSKAQDVFEGKLWNGEYYNFDEYSRSAKTIMADQLCGNWFLESISSELAHKLLPASHVKSALNKIYNFNVLKFGGGRLGAVNGMRKNGTIDRQYMEADEMWIGITYALAASFMQQGEIQRGFDTAWSCYDACYNRFGLQFQTPEALYEDRFYRAVGYMRPLSIWAIQWTLARQFKVFEPNSIILNHICTSTPASGKRASPEGVEEDDEDEGYGKVDSDTSSRCSKMPSTSSVPSVI